ncbi:hypothetical protein Tco_0417735 [Tanacetum coccineum]
MIASSTAESNLDTLLDSDSVGGRMITKSPRDPSEKHEPEDDDDDDDTDNEDEEPTKEEEEEHLALADSSFGTVAEDVGYVRALQASKYRMMTSIEEFHDARTDRRDIRLEIDVVRGHRTAYETELLDVHQTYLSSEARNKALLARLETLKTHMSHMEWQRRSAEDFAIRQMMRT